MERCTSLCLTHSRNPNLLFTLSLSISNDRHYLDRMGLDGEIPNEIRMLKTLQVLDFTFNEKLVGRFPGAVCELSNLDSLYLGHTHIAGELPACIGQLNNLRSFFVSSRRPATSV